MTVRYGWIKVCALVAMGVMLLVMAACGGTPAMAPAGRPRPAYSSAVTDGLAEVLDGIYGLYPQEAPALPQSGEIDSLGISYHVPGMEDFHGYRLPVQFYFEYRYEDDGVTVELDSIRDSLDSVDFESEESDRMYVSGMAGEYAINISVFVKDGPDTMHYSVEMPEEKVDRDAFVQKARIGPDPDMIYGSTGDVEYTRNVFTSGEQWVWAYLTDAAPADTVAWYQARAEADGYTGVTTQTLDSGEIKMSAPGTGGLEAWTVQVEDTGQGYTYVWFSQMHDVK